MGDITGKDGETGGPRKFSAAGLLTMIPGLAQCFKPVPQSHMRHLGGDRALVTCVCGRRPVLCRGELIGCERAHQWVPGVRGDCPRTFIYANRAVLVTGGPAR